MSVSPARALAFRILLQVLKESAYASELLHSQSANSLQEKDLALATELVYGVLRQQSLIDWNLSHHCNSPLEKLDSEVILALRLGAYQILFLNRVPVRAAIYESVELVKAARLKSAAGLVNAVLRRIGKEDTTTEVNKLPSDSVSGMSIRYSHPEWLVKRWLARYGSERTIQILRHNNHPPCVVFRINSPNLSGNTLLHELARRGVSIRHHQLSEEILEVVEGNITQTDLFGDHSIFIQDAASQVIVRLLELQPGDQCLDLCSGQGGKASQIALLLGEQFPVIATDLYWHRLRVSRQLHAAHWHNLTLVAADGTKPLPFKRKFDKILLDAPCSGTGTLQRHPEIRWRLRPSRLQELQALQTALLENAVLHLKPGGTIVYSTCSLEEEENEFVVEGFLRAHPGVCLDLPRAANLRLLFNEKKYLHLFPPDFQCDGFFAALLRNQSGGNPEDI